jgi:hypothetical protein
MVVMVMAAGAWAGPGLDYVAFEACPDAGRFSDEVSARVGAQAFGRDAGVMVVRLAEVGGEVLGTLELGEGTRMVRGASCQEAFDGLVVAAATVLGAPPSAGAPAVEPEPAQPGMVEVHMDSTRPGVTVARITGRGTAVGAGGSASAVFYEDLCIAPCTFQLPPGFHELGTYGKGTRGVTRKLQLEGTELHLRSKPSSIWTMVGGTLLGSGGLLMTITGADFNASPICEDYDAWTTDQIEIPVDQQCVARTHQTMGALTAGGLLAVGVSIPLIFSGGKIEQVP